MEPSSPKHTVGIIITSIIVIALIIWAGVYYAQNRSVAPAALDSTPSLNSGTSTSATTTDGTDQPASPDEKSAVDAYMRAHINALSPKAPASGSTFTVTSVTVEYAGRALVEYTDGTTSYTAAASYHVDASGTVVVDTFDLLVK